MPVHVPQLRKKLKLLGDHGPRWNLPDIAERLGVAVGTVEWWADGDRDRDPDMVPDKRMDGLVRLFDEALPGSYSRDDVEALIEGSVRALERALTADKSQSIDDLIAAEAKTGTGRIRRPRSLGLVEHVEENDDLPLVRLNEEFLIEWNTSRRGFLLVLQHAQQIWGAVQFADGSVSIQHEPGPVLVPGIRDKRFIPMRETTSVGLHRFILVVSPEPFPAEVMRPAQARTQLDWQTLGDLAAHYQRQHAHLRELHALELNVTGRQGDQPR
ncbi:MAG: hypothetical protein WDZ83_20485 [Rhizobiaceae bacterium]